MDEGNGDCRLGGQVKRMGRVGKWERKKADGDDVDGDELGANLVKLQRWEVFSADLELFLVEGVLQSLVTSKEEPHPGTGGGAGVLASQKEPDQKACYLVVC